MLIGIAWIFELLAGNSWLETAGWKLLASEHGFLGKVKGLYKIIYRHTRTLVDGVAIITHTIIEWQTGVKIFIIRTLQKLTEADS